MQVHLIAMLGRDPHPPALGQERSMVEHILELYAASGAIFTFAFLALASRRLSGRTMIKLPHEFVNTIFAAAIIVANVRRSRNWLRGSPDLHERS
jgi:hypothetical protein